MMHQAGIRFAESAAPVERLETHLARYGAHSLGLVITTRVYRPFNVGKDISDGTRALRDDSSRTQTVSRVLN